MTRGHGGRGWMHVYSVCTCIYYNFCHHCNPQACKGCCSYEDIAELHCKGIYTCLHYLTFCNIICRIHVQCMLYVVTNIYDIWLFSTSYVLSLLYIIYLVQCHTRNRERETGQHSTSNILTGKGMADANLHMQIASSETRVHKNIYLFYVLLPESIVILTM